VGALTFSGTRPLATVVVPVFGLYAGYENSVSIQIAFTDASVQTIPLTLLTDGYTDPHGIYDHPVFIKKRAPGSTLGFDFFAMKSNLGTPVIVDTDGEIRWVGGPGTASGLASIFTDNGFVIGDQKSMATYRLELNGSFTEAVLTTPNYSSYNHNIDPGKVGFLANITTLTDVDSVISEFNYPAGFGKEWDMGALLTAYMASHGDDPTKLVRPGVDWFHSNAATYDPRDNSVIVSSRENFLIKIDYDTGDIIWIFGDPTKYWYSFPSLRAKALTLASGGLYPIGQHATSITSDGLLMIFNDGYPSINQPPGEPAGALRTYSAVSAYAIDVATLTATEVWRFDYGQSIFSGICSSSYEAPGKTYLVDYAVADNDTRARLVGLDANLSVVFDFQYVSAPCQTSWNAVPEPLEQMIFQ
jgi:arylsulfate sulfotransferase